MAAHIVEVLAAFAAGAALSAILLHRQRQRVSAASKQSEIAVQQQIKHDVVAVAKNELVLCSMCGVLQPRAVFSPRQMRKHAGWRKPKCRTCVDSYEAKPTGAPAAPCVRPPKLPLAAAAAAEPAVDDVSDPLRKARKAETVLRLRTERVLLVLENCADDLNHVAVLRTCEALGVMRVWLIEAHDASAKSGADAAPTGSADAAASADGDFASGAADSQSIAAGSAAGNAAKCGSTAAMTKAGQRRKARASQRGFDYDELLGVRRAQQYCNFLDVRRFRSAHACIEALREDGRTIWCTDLAQDATPLTADAAKLAEQLPLRVAVVLGSEGAGVSEVMLRAADLRVYLPMFGFTEVRMAALDFSALDFESRSVPRCTSLVLCLAASLPLYHKTSLALLTPHLDLALFRATTSRSRQLSCCSGCSTLALAAEATCRPTRPHAREAGGMACWPRRTASASSSAG